jgi:tetrahydromethanopterin S-methyltransferase subunit G
MPDLINKLSTYASLVGVVCAIGGGFYAWGEFQTRLNALEGVSSTDLSGVHAELKELREKLDIKTQELQSEMNGNFIELLDMQAADHNELKDRIDVISKDVAINGAAVEYLDAKINELKAANDNPLLN